MQRSNPDVSLTASMRLLQQRGDIDGPFHVVAALIRQFRHVETQVNTERARRQALEEAQPRDLDDEAERVSRLRTPGDPEPK